MKEETKYCVSYKLDELVNEGMKLRGESAWEDAANDENFFRCWVN